MIKTLRIWFRAATSGLLLSGCLLAPPAYSQEIFTWVDDDGVTHFGHAATAGHKATQENSKYNPTVSMDETHDPINPAVSTATLAVNQMESENPVQLALSKALR